MVKRVYQRGLRPLQVREKDLSFGRCWARCDVPSTWEVRWEGSANVDDGTAQVSHACLYRRERGRLAHHSVSAYDVYNPF